MPEMTKHSKAVVWIPDGAKKFYITFFDDMESLPQREEIATEYAMETIRRFLTVPELEDTQGATDRRAFLQEYLKRASFEKTSELIKAGRFDELAGAMTGFEILTQMMAERAAEDKAAAPMDSAMQGEAEKMTPNPRYSFDPAKCVVRDDWHEKDVCECDKAYTAWYVCRALERFDGTLKAQGTLPQD